MRIGKQKAESYIAQKWDEGKIFGEEDLYTEIKCLKMIRIRSIDCCFDEFKICGTLMRSEKKIPGVVYANLRPSIISVTSVDDNTNFIYTSLRKYKNSAKRKYGNRGDYYYYFSDGYIYIPDVHVEAVNVKVVTMNKKDAEALSGCGADEESACKSQWDYTFVCPAKLIEYVATETLNECLTKVKIPTDENPDMNSNKKTQTVQQP